MINVFFFKSSDPSPPPDKVTAYSTSSTSVVVKWSHVPRKYFRGEPIGYKIIYKSDMDSDYKIVNVNYSTNTMTLTNLHVYTNYIIGVSGVSSGGEGHANGAWVSTGEIILLFLSCLVNWFIVLRGSLLFIDLITSLSHFQFST